ncbi:hypothetical protein HNQ93_000433 [Hymenobacter luteus]|uniref:Roadblock/LAMTOR2 domain-containing protein n=2 Tax=Hymenobacter TaxID=89966 RepID=A0A7W9SZ27_9BACT|nr:MULTISPECIES: hypothetical protein [Hymenobacter]MBB4600087.1 hypothetical protein [Hymenobacter latericoloratus]MBB6057603.1 hypothetical protein [Hymenobacter luteus]
MRLPFLHKVAVKKITGDATGPEREQAETIIRSVLGELPELIAAAVVDISSGKTLVAYTTQSSFDLYKISSRNAELIRTTHRMLLAPWLENQQLTDLVVLLEDQLHCLRTTANQRWLCYVAVRSADTNMALVREVMRRCAA